MATIQTGNSVTGYANVDSNNNLQVRTPLTEIQGGFVQLSGEIDAGTVTGTRRVKACEVSEDFRLRVGLDSQQFYDVFTSTAINSSLWQTPVNVSTLTVAGGFMTLNANANTASGSHSRCSSYITFAQQPGFGLYFRSAVQFPVAPQANNVCEWGLGFATGTAAPTDGAFFRINAAGEFRGFVNYNGTELQTGTFTAPAAGVTQHFIIQLTDDAAEFWIDDILQGEILLGAAGALNTSSGALPVLFRCYNTGIVALAQQMKVAWVNVTRLDQSGTMPYNVMCSAMGGTALQGQTGQTQGGTANYANGANPTPAVPTNTTAALGTGFGGQFWETDTAVVNLDCIISSYLNPAGTATAPGKVLMVTSVKIDTYIQTALTGGGYNEQWCLCFGHNLLSLATAEASASSTKAPRRIALGSRTVAAGAVALTQLPTIGQILFPEGIPLNPGEYVAIVKKKVGTAPSAGVMAHMITLTGHNVM